MCACGGVWRMGEAPVGAGGRVACDQPCRTRNGHASGDVGVLMGKVVSLSGPAARRLCEVAVLAGLSPLG